MKPKRRLTNRDLLLLAAPVPALWLFLGCFVHPAVFRFWVMGQSIYSSDALLIGGITLFFTVIYPFLVASALSLGSPLNRTTVAICAVIAVMASYALAPVT